MHAVKLANAMLFLSTLSLRRATGCFSRVAVDPAYFYPRSPCGERRISSIINNVVNDFYPRSPCGERHTTWLPAARQNVFLSTLSLRRATIRTYQRHFPSNISIHALLAESDYAISCYLIRWNLFLSTLSLRRATSWSGFSECIYAFLSTLSLRRATPSSVNIRLSD